MDRKYLIAKKALENSYSPYSLFRVAAILTTKCGKEFIGVNVENASFGATICAERSAIIQAVSLGYKQFESIYIISDMKNYTPPCFLCRQVMLEFFDDRTNVIMVNNNGESKEIKFKELVPHKFNKDNLGDI